jgi:hypothetical protein
MVDFARNDDEYEDEKCFRQESRDQVSVGKDSERSFSGQARGGTGESRAD